MQHAFHAYIDESGDEGFSFREPPQQGSSEWFVLSACVVRAKNLAAIARQFAPTFKAIETAGRVAHFRKLPDAEKLLLAESIGAKSIKTVSVCVNKRQLQEKYTDHTLDRRRRLYFYASRLLLERITWIARDYKDPLASDHRCKLVFSRNKHFSYERLCRYLDDLQENQTRIEWDYIDLRATTALNHDDSIWLRVADTIASATASALELGKCDDYVLAMRKVMYRYRERQCRNYGLKFFPHDPVEEKSGRYRWIAAAVR